MPVRMVMLGVLGCMVLAASAGAAEPVGQIKILEGPAEVVRGGAVAALGAGAPVYAADEIVTKDKARLGLIFNDDTTLAMGPDSRLVVEKLDFEPGADKLDMGLALNQGTFSVQTGQIAKLAPSHTDIRTPQMTIGIRGTSFLVKVDGNE